MRNSYITGLYKLVEQQQQERQLTKEAPMQTVKPLDQQLVELIRTFNKEQLSRGWHISEFVMRTTGTFADGNTPNFRGPHK